MNTNQTFPLFDECFADLNRFILGLANDYQAGTLNSWDELEQNINAYFTAARVAHIDTILPGWKKMASYVKGVTLVHVMCVFLGLFMLPEFQSLRTWEKQIAKWSVLFHDVEKEIQKGKRDPIHGFRSAVIAATYLPDYGFPTTPEFFDRIAPWSQLTHFAIRNPAGSPEPVQDNSKLPEILLGIEEMFGEDTPAALIVKSVLLHMSIDVVIDWPQAAPLTKAEIQRYVSRELVPLLKVLMLADNEGWVLFSPERQEQRSNTLGVFQEIEKMISS